MKNLNNIVAALTMIAVLTFGSTFANAGIVIAGLNDDSGKTRAAKQVQKSEPCTTTDEPQKSDLVGIIPSDYIGIVIAGIIGIVIAGAADEPKINCGIVIAG